MSQISVSRDQIRVHSYEILSTAVSYPDERTFAHFPHLAESKQDVIVEYDKLFRNSAIWLYSSEYTAHGQFQKTKQLSDISGFYRAFGLQIEKDRPDALSVELEFMHFLIFKSMYASENNVDNSEEKIELCNDAQSKFFRTYLYPSASAIGEQVADASAGVFYKEIFEELLLFMEKENEYFQETKREAL